MTQVSKPFIQAYYPFFYFPFFDHMIQEQNSTQKARSPDCERVCIEKDARDVYQTLHLGVDVATIVSDLVSWSLPTMSAAKPSKIAKMPAHIKTGYRPISESPQGTPSPAASTTPSPQATPPSPSVPRFMAPTIASSSAAAAAAASALDSSPAAQASRRSNTGKRVAVSTSPASSPAPTSPQSPSSTPSPPSSSQAGATVTSQPPSSSTNQRISKLPLSTPLSFADRRGTRSASVPLTSKYGSFTCAPIPEHEATSSPVSKKTNLITPPPKSALRGTAAPGTRSPSSPLQIVTSEHETTTPARQTAAEACDAETPVCGT